jgi:phosphomannomutase
VTASHNPRPWNGLKCLTAAGAAPPADDAARIIDRFRSGGGAIDPPEAYPPVSRDDTGHDRHVERVLATVHPEPIRRRRFRVLLDSVNGAGGAAGRRLLERLGCTVVHDHAEPTGHFAHPPEPTAENLAETAVRTRAEACDIGFAQDPDADRLAIIDENGRYIGEELTLALAVTEVLARRGPGAIVVNLSTSRMVDDIAAAHLGATVLRTPVGEANVVLAMRRSSALVGGEGNGGVIVPEVCGVRDSLSAMALVLGLLAKREQPLSAVVASLPRYEMVKHAIGLDAAGDPEAFRRMIAPRVVAAYAGARIDTADGVRVDLEDGWVHLRPSNTEPIVRVIAEAATKERAWALVEEMSAFMSDQATKRPSD